jgi:2-keto-4-pentenoate hydratase/2-oxohepta-3-ene-1,7-dioic acid hydratase in catechol pathway
MKLGTFKRGKDGPARVGALAGDGLVDLTDAIGATSLKSLLGEGLAGLGKVREAVQRARGETIPERDVTLLPPIPDPSMFFCVGKNNREHLEELVRTNLIKEIPDEPTGFLKLNSVLVGQDAEVARPDGIVQFDYEPELAFVIGKPGYRISKARAMDHVVAITAFNDLTAREVQKKEAKTGTKFWTAKNMPGFGPVGPYIVTIDEVQDINDLWINCSVNGERRTRFNTRDQIYNASAIIEHFSRYMPLRAGDVFATGSAGGVAIGQPNAAELFLKPGDEVVMTIESLLSLRTRIV